MKIKVCGMKHPDNIRALENLPIDFMGMIFYHKSPRYIGDQEIDNHLADKIKRVGVFVNSDMDYINQMVNKYSLALIQLHGNESPELCKRLDATTPVIKAFSISDASDFGQTSNYEGACSYFLFDTKTPQYGGSGQKFDWNILNEYKGNTPFFLSGGISREDAGKIKEIQHPMFYGVDLNSRFETEPGSKNIELLNQFIKELRDEQN